MQERTVRERRSPKVARDIRGMNAVELVMVVLLVGIMGAVATPLINNVVRRNRLDGAARKIASDLRYAQSLAVSRGGLFRLNTATGTCTTVSGQTRYRIEQFPIGGGAWSAFTECYLLSSEFQGAALASIADSDGGAPTITDIQFNSRGTCQNCTSGGATPPFIIRIAAASGTRTVQVRTTGSVSVQSP